MYGWSRTYSSRFRLIFYKARQPQAQILVSELGK